MLNQRKGPCQVTIVVDNQGCYVYALLMTLIEQAKQHKARKTQPTFDPGELLEMAFATITGEITVGQAARALYPARSNTNGYYHVTSAKLLKRLREAIAQGSIRIVKVHTNVP